MVVQFYDKDFVLTSNDNCRCFIPEQKVLRICSHDWDHNTWKYVFSVNFDHRMLFHRHIGYGVKLSITLFSRVFEPFQSIYQTDFILLHSSLFINCIAFITFWIHHIEFITLHSSDCIYFILYIVLFTFQDLHDNHCSLYIVFIAFH